MRSLLRLLSADKRFDQGWVGNPTLNALGMHLSRIRLSDAMLAARRTALGSRELAPELLETLRRDGVVVMPNALPAATFEAAAREARARMQELDAAHPRPTTTHERGFGAKRPLSGGFDRFDGDTLNRFAHLSGGTTPALAQAVRDPRLARLCTLAAGFRHHPERFDLYLTIAGDERVNPDPQRALHRDTFHSTIKLWLFLDEVRLEDGPFEYVVGSHRVDALRARWEERRANESCSADAADPDGSFRIDESELPSLGLAAPRAFPAAANTLVLADVRGFHRRGLGTPGAERLALYANLRLWPFSPVPY